MVPGSLFRNYWQTFGNPLPTAVFTAMAIQVSVVFSSCQVPPTAVLVSIHPQFLTRPHKKS